MRSANQEPSKTNPFEPANLSPVPGNLVACALPYGLTWQDLRGILPGFAGRESTDIQAFSSYEKQGLNGDSNSCILTLRYPTGENQFRSETVFIKHAADQRNTEAQKYQALASFGIPTPRLLAVIYKEETEIIFLEFLPKIGIDFRSVDEVNNLLQLIAQVNSIQDPPDLFNLSPGIPQAEFDERVQAALAEITRARSWPITIDVPRWLQAYQVVQDACKSMPQAVNHNEFSFQQVGWAQRDGTSQLVVFDLETMGLSPRFADMAGILTRLAMYTERDQLELFGIYLDRFRELKGLKLGIDEAFHEMRLTRLTDAFNSLPWFVDIARSADLNQMLDDPLSTAIHSLQDDLVALGFL
jgi:hypothetical protein